MGASTPSAQRPESRRLRVFAYDPSFGLRLDMAGVNGLTISIPWECDPMTGDSMLRKGPVGEYVEVVDADPASGVFYAPVDLNDPALLVQDGLRPDEGNPHFHQQMVYAVAMATIGQFERALGRVALWASHRVQAADGKPAAQYVPRLRLYPHALRDRNAYYSPDRKAILFGYFPTTLKDANNTPGTIVFTCLSHDVIAHEVTHALLDGIHPRFNESTNVDVFAFHEAFADLVAMFQRFSYPGVLREQIGRTRGDLGGETLLAQLAQEFGQATGRNGALRDALGSVDPVTKKWKRREPDPRALERAVEPHERGAILVAAVFGAFVAVYRRRTADLYRIATQGTGRLPEGDIHPDLTGRLAEEAGRAAQYVLTMCIRALDCCPPVDIAFGDFLRAVITGDLELNPADEPGYRIAFIESFRAWGIVPRGVRGMSVDCLQHESGVDLLVDPTQSPTSLRMSSASSSESRREAQEVFQRDMKQLQVQVPPDDDAEAPHLRTAQPLRFEVWNLESSRKSVWEKNEDNRLAFWRWLMRGDGRSYAAAFGLVLDPMAAPPTVYRNKRGEPTVEVHSVRTALRRSTRGALLSDLVVEITQRRRGYFDKEKQVLEDAKHPMEAPGEIDGDFKYRAGCTVLIDPTSMTVRRIIRTAGTIADNEQLERLRRFLTRETGASANAFDGDPRDRLHAVGRGRRREPFAMLHRHEED